MGNNQIQVTFSGSNQKEIWGVMNEYMSGTTGGSVPKVGPATKTGKTKKAEADEETFDLSTPSDTEEEVDLSSDDAADLDDEEEETPAITKAQLLKGFKAYAADKGRNKALAILTSLKVKTVHDIPTAKYETVWKKLNA